MADDDSVIRHPLVAHEGRLAILITIILGLSTYLWFGFVGAVPAIAATGFLLLFFRDPTRTPHLTPLAIVAPVNGRVTRVEAGFDPWLGREASLVSVRMGLFDVHSMFSPMEGKIIEQWSAARHARDEDALPRRAVAYQIQTDEGDDIVFEIARGQIGGVIRFYYQPGERIGHGRRIGFARMGCRVTLYAARESRIDCGVGDRVEAAVDTLMTLVHDTPVTALPDEEEA